jgi:ankyrin repeat protein
MEQDNVAPTGRVMLHEYAKSGSADLVLALLDEKSATVDERSSLGDTALIWAARSNHVSTIEALASRGASLDAANNQGDTALHLAAFKGHLEACKCLVKLGASRTLVNKAGKRALDLARSVPVKVAVAPEEDNADGYSGSGSDEDF